MLIDNNNVILLHNPKCGGVSFEDSVNSNNYQRIYHNNRWLFEYIWYPYFLYQTEYID